MTRLEHMFELQKEFDIRVLDKVGKLPQHRRLYEISCAMEGEVHELQECLGYLPHGVRKWWKKSIDKKHLLEETIDVLHFLLSFWHFMGVKTEDIYDAYTTKIATNHKRQNENY